MSKKKWVAVAALFSAVGLVSYKERDAVADTLERWSHGKI